MRPRAGEGLVRWTSLAAALILAATEALYLWIVLGVEDDNAAAIVAVVGAFLALTAIACALAAFVRVPAATSLLLGGAAGSCLALGIAGIFSIGMLCLVAGGFALASLLAANRLEAVRAKLAVAAGAAAVVVVAAGIWLAS